MKFNQTRYRKLLMYSYQLKKEKNTHISEISDSDFRELLSYSAATYSRLVLESYQSYATPIKQFLEVQISAGQLAVELSEVEELHEKVHDILESNLVILLPNSKADLVSDLLSHITWTLEDLSYRDDLAFQFSNEYKYQEAVNKLESRMYNSIRETYLQLESIVQNYRRDSKVSKNLSQLVDQLNWENKDEYIDMIEEFLNDSDLDNFLLFQKRYKSIVEVAKYLEGNSISLKLNYQALGFSKYILILIQLFDSYQADSQISPKVLKSWIRKILFEMKNHYS